MYFIAPLLFKSETYLDVVLNVFAITYISTLDDAEFDLVIGFSSTREKVKDDISLTQLQETPKVICKELDATGALKPKSEFEKFLVIAQLKPILESYLKENGLDWQSISPILAQIPVSKFPAMSAFRTDPKKVLYDESYELGEDVQKQLIIVHLKKPLTDAIQIASPGVDWQYIQLALNQLNVDRVETRSDKFTSKNQNSIAILSEKSLVEQVENYAINKTKPVILQPIQREAQKYTGSSLEKQSGDP